MDKLWFQRKKNRIKIWLKDEIIQEVGEFNYFIKCQVMEETVGKL